jgi:hypothetical protein
MRVLVWMLSSIILMGCVKHGEGHSRHQRHRQHRVISQPMKQPVSSIKPNVITAFNVIHADGNMDIQLATGMKTAVKIQGNQDDTQHVHAIVNQKVLTLAVDPNHPPSGRITVVIQTPSLHAFIYRGQGFINAPTITSNGLILRIDNQGRTIIHGRIVLHELMIKGQGYTEIKGITGSGLSIDMHGNPTVRLSGVAPLRHLAVNGGGSLSLYWVKSPQLVMTQKGHALVQLAGVADRVDAELWNFSRLNTRYLRVKNIFIKTHDCAHADILTLGKQHTLAMDNSRIILHKIPKMAADFMQNNGSVLHLT